MHPQNSWTLTEIMGCMIHTCTYKKPTHTQMLILKSWKCRFQCTLCTHIRACTQDTQLGLRWFMSVRLRFAWFILLKLHCAPEGLSSPLHTLHGGLLVRKHRRNVRVLAWSLDLFWCMYLQCSQHVCVYRCACTHANFGLRRFWNIVYAK